MIKVGDYVVVLKDYSTSKKGSFGKVINTENNIIWIDSSMCPHLLDTTQPNNINELPVFKSDLKLISKYKRKLYE